MMTISSGATRFSVAADPFVEQVGIEVIGPQVGDLQIERLSLRSNRFEIGVFGADLLRQAQPRDQPTIAFDQVVREISGQRDAENRPDNEAAPAAAIRAKQSWCERSTCDSEQSTRRCPNEPEFDGKGRSTAASTERPANTAEAPSCSSMRISWLYLASRSERDSDPVLIWPQLVATARSAIVVSSVSPERCENTVPQPARWAISTASSVSDKVPIWLTLTSSALAMPRRSRRAAAAGWSRTRHRRPAGPCRRAPRSSIAQPSQSSSAMPSSIETIG